MNVEQEVLALRAKTALERYDFSRPVKLGLRDGIITKDSSVFDYGCGKGADVQFLQALGINVSGWDPHFFPSNERTEADVINLGYVLNVIENPSERALVLKSAFQLAGKCLIVAVQSDLIAPSKGEEFNDGILTSRNTFQKYFSNDEFKSLIQSVTGVAPYIVDRGIAYVFKSSEYRTEYLSRRYDSTRYLQFVAAPFTKERPQRAPSLRQQTIAALESNPAAQQLTDWVSQRGRMPRDFELNDLVDSKVLGISKATLEKWVLDRVDREAFDRATTIRKRDLLILLALMKLDVNGRPKLNELPPNILHDVKGFFGTYAKACSLADALLFSVGNKENVIKGINDSEFGKKLPDSIYFHSSTLPFMADVIQIFVGCARALIGDIETEHVIKISKKAESVSFLMYPDFETDPHPSLHTSIKVNLYKRSVQYRDYTKSDNPPILHRKETFLTPLHPMFEKFKVLTEKEEALGLLSRTDIGFKKQWEDILNQNSPPS